MKKKTGISLVVVIGIIILAFATKETKTGYSISTKINLTEQEIDLGVIKLDSFSRVTLPIKNIGKQPLIIKCIEKSTEDIVIDQTVQVFRQNTPVVVDLLYQPQDIGKVNEFIIVKGNFPEEELVIKVVGEVVN